MRRRDFLSRTAYTAGLAAAAVSLPIDLLLGEAAKREALAAGLPTPQNMPMDHFVVLMMENRSFDHYFGWLPDADGVQDRTYQDPDNGGAPVSTRHASTLGEGQWQGCGHPDPDHSWNGGRAQLGSARTNTRARARRVPRRRQRRVRALLLRRGRPRLHPPRRPRVHGLRPLPLLADGPHLAQPLLHVVGAVRRQAEQQPAGRHARQPVGDALRPRAEEQPGATCPGQGADRPLLQLRPSVLGGVGTRAARPGRGRWPTTTPTARPARCPTSRSSTRPSATAAAATACRPTSTRSGTCGSGRRSCRTSCTRSWSRPTGSAARCSSSTTSGAASSTTCGRRACPTPAAAPTSTWTSG